MAVLTLILVPSIGAMLPSAWLTRKVEERKTAIFKDLPDTLDLLAISVEAGMGFEGALEIVCQHFRSPLADEFHRTGAIYSMAKAALASKAGEAPHPRPHESPSSSSSSTSPSPAPKESF